MHSANLKLIIADKLAKSNFSIFDLFNSNVRRLDNIRQGRNAQFRLLELEGVDTDICDTDEEVQTDTAANDTDGNTADGIVEHDTDDGVEKIYVTD